MFTGLRTKIYFWITVLMSETVKVPHCSAWPQTHLGDSGPWLSDGSHLIAHGDERHSRRLRKRRAKENKRFCRGQASCRDDVDGFPLSSTKPSTVYHEFHVFDSDVPPYILPLIYWTLPTTVPFVSTGGGTEGDVTHWQIDTAWEAEFRHHPVSGAIRAEHQASC